MKTLKVTCAIVFWSGRLFAAQRPQHKSLPGYWELPGGKLEEGESMFACIVREMSEELQMQVKPKRVLAKVFHDYGDFSIELYPIMCVVESSDFRLHEHKDAGWFEIDELESLKWAPADIPIVKQIIQGEI